MATEANLGAASEEPLLSIVNPATGVPIAEVAPAHPPDVRIALGRARAAQREWAALAPRERGRALRQLAARIRDDARLTETLVAESGKPHYEAEGIEVFYTLELTRYLTGRAGRAALRDDVRRPFVFAHKRARVVQHPRGVVGVIGPWNWPLLNNYADCVAPLMAGNAVILKPSEWTPLTSLRVAELWRELGLPDGVFQVLPGRGDVGRALCEACDMIFFTGSQKVGREVAALCGQRLIPSVMELGGKSPLVVLADADLPRAAHAAVWSAFAHSGQVCIRTERVLVEEVVADRFTELCRAEIARLRQGPSLPGRDHDDRVDVGAITFAPQITRAEEQIADAVEKGARVLTGGQRMSGPPGRFFEPTLLAGVTAGMAVAHDETFGPLLPIIRVRDEAEALRMVNESPFGLSGSVWTRDAARGRAFARRMVAGSVCVNDALMNYFVVEAPLGGVKSSGLGVRHGPEGLRQFCRGETIVEDHPLLGWLSPFVQRQLAFPYQYRTLRLLRWLMKKVY
ncbi:MAG TPA: aldehyde dehydrogenase family protein [Polyangia bacterium]|nr:aldehyde dehydrogenase family protein [Polyangia bacterium]